MEDLVGQQRPEDGGKSTGLKDEVERRAEKASHPEEGGAAAKLGSREA